MELSEALKAVDALRQADELISALGQCRSACEKIAETVRQADPKAQIKFLFYHHPGAPEKEGDHYAVKVTKGDQEVIINPVPAPGFPEYVGGTKEAPGLFGKMIEVDKVT